MFIHTLTFLNNSKSSPSTTYLEYQIPNLCFIIQSSLKMQYMNCASTLNLSSVFVQVSVPHLHHHFIIYVFIWLFFNIIVLILDLSSFLLLPLQSAHFHSGCLSFRSPCRCRLIPQGSLLISAVILPLSPQPSHLLTIVFF